MTHVAVRTNSRNKSVAQFAAGLATNGLPREIFTKGEWEQLSSIFELTPRQRQIAGLMCEGRSYKSIAGQADISINTVRMHMRTLFAKLGVHDRVGLVLQLIAAQRVLAARGRTALGG
jgi:DNA-binding CsgD family transcriptional regulator